MIFTKSVAGRRGVRLPRPDVPTVTPVPTAYRRGTELRLCELSELDVVRHFTELSQRNVGVDSRFYPLGSCTMKYNPKVCEKIAQLEGFVHLHPLLPQLRHGGMLTQGALAVLYELEQILCEITAMDAFTLQPLAGAHGELTGMMIIAAYHRDKGNRKTEVLIPDEAHGTNPSSAAIAGYEVKAVRTNPTTGMIDAATVAEAIGPQTAAVMMTNPNTLGIFESDVEKIAKIVHDAGGLLYYDGANMNAIMGKTSPGKMGFDIVHLNLHKTFSTPHGGGGPGAGPVGVVEKLAKFLPVPIAEKKGEGYILDYDRPDSIGKVHGFHGNWGVLLRAYTYILSEGGNGLTDATEMAVLNSNYLRQKVEKYLEIPYPGLRKHEFVASGASLKKNGVKTLDVAKRLIDHGFHPPTVYFPHLVDESIMIEPTETESKATLDGFAAALEKVVGESPEVLHNAPSCASVRRLNETDAAKNLILSYRDWLEFQKRV